MVSTLPRWELFLFLAVLLGRLFLFKGGAAVAKVKVVNAQEFDGVFRKQGEVFEVSAGRARDLEFQGKVTLAVDRPDVSVKKEAVKNG